MIVGSGINSLVCAALLGRNGMSVTVLEQAGELGGAVRTGEITLPGFRHDLYSAWHPLFVASNAYAELSSDLARHGLSYRCAEAVTATAFPDHSSRLLTRDRTANVAELDAEGGRDGASYQMDREDFDRFGAAALGLLGTEVLGWGGARFALDSLRRHGRRQSAALLASLVESTRSWVGRAFNDPATGGLFAPWVLHTGLGPDSSGSGFMSRAIVGLLEGFGLPVPEGGASHLVDALVGLVGEQGGLCRTGAEVEAVLVRRGRARGVRLVGGEVVEAGRAVVCNVPPPALYGRLLADAPLPAWARQAASHFRFGRAGMQLHYALSSPPRWLGDERLASVPIVHLTGGLDAVARAVGEAERGLLPAEATIVCGQPCVVDPGRAPEGASILWVQLQELPRRPVGDAAGELAVDDGWDESLRERYADRIERRIAHQLEGFYSQVLARRVLSPADLEAANPNLVGGDIYSGACDLDQGLFFRPRPELNGHQTPIKGCYEIGASTHPGPGLGAGSGTIVARHLLRARRPGGLPGPASRLVGRARASAS
ncbi:MAG: phytoene desaturase family protein [Acidimicrobiales bacterium]